MWIYNCAFSIYLNPRIHPALVMVPYNAPDDQVNQLINNYLDKLQVPYLCVQNDAVVSLYSTALDSALVISFCSPVCVCVVPVRNKGPNCQSCVSSIFDAIASVTSSNEDTLKNDSGEIDVVMIGSHIPPEFAEQLQSARIYNEHHLNLRLKPLSKM